MDDVLAKATELGKAIRATEKFRLLREAETAVMNSADSVKLAEALGTIQRERMEAARDGKALPPEAEGRLQKILAAAGLDPRLQALSLAQQEFQALVDRVNHTMLDELR
jgi:cell fate (sporulation/competence/biofilm development) regulator YlbF (YheA/YmcA/DUF963 family)